MTQRRRRWAKWICGVPLLPFGIAAILLDVGTWIQSVINQDPNLRVVTTAPVGLIIGFPLAWFGYGLLFRPGFDRLTRQEPGPSED